MYFKIILYTFPFHGIGQLTTDKKAIISNYVRRSNLINPYGNEDKLWKWLFIINNSKKIKNTKSASRKKIQSRTVKDENRPDYFQYIEDDRLEGEIPTWDITLDELKTFYVKVYKDRFLQWYHEDHTTEGRFEVCTYRNLPRRIGWLYPDDCKYTSSKLFLLKFNCTTK